MSKKKTTEEVLDDAVSNEAAQEVEINTGADESTNTDIEILKTENEALKEMLQQKEEIILRKSAEFENLKKRTQREISQSFQDARIASIKEFLEVFDDLERTIDALKDTEETPFIKGVKLVRNKFADILEHKGVERIDEVGVPFNVDLHDALLKQPASDENTGSDIVLQVLESGYRMGERVIRHAKVIVSE